MQRRTPPRSTPALGETAVLYALVALGSALGGTLRGALALAAAGGTLPWPTLLVNMLGSFAIALYATLAAPEGRLRATPRQRHFVMTGFCGGFTTFSVFSLETLRLVQAGRAGMAAGLVAVSAAAWLLAAWLGHLAALRLNCPKGRT